MSTHTVRAAGTLDLPVYKAANIISSCSILKQPNLAIPAKSSFPFNSPFVVQVSNDVEMPFRYVVASVHIVVRQNGVILEGASSVVDPYTGTATFEDFKLISASNFGSITYDIFSNGVRCRPVSSSISETVLAAFNSGNSIRISTIPSAVLVIPDFFSSPTPRSVYAGVQSASVDFYVLDANEAILVGVIVQVKVLTQRLK
jgi:hypothetical protein